MKRTKKIHKVNKSVQGRSTGEAPSPSDAQVWSPAMSRTCLFALTLLCLLPFVGKAFHMDDTLFNMGSEAHRREAA
jgi:hypothetical protein